MDISPQAHRSSAEHLQLIGEARLAGEAHGRAAASWFFDGSTERETYQRVLEGIEDGDPAIMDELPYGPLSGEWAGDPTYESVLADLGVEAEYDGADDLIVAYEDGFYDVSLWNIETACRYQLTGSEG